MKNRILSLLAFCFATLAALGTAQAGDYCFGASGQQCGGFRDGELAGIAFCVPIPFNSNLACQISGGSMTHDPCCVDRPGGVMCSGSPLDDDQRYCKSEWDRAVHRAFWGYQWTRAVNGNRENTTGNVVRAEYCASRNAGVHRNDRNYCCSGSARRAGFWDRLGRPSLYRCN